MPMTSAHELHVPFVPALCIGTSRDLNLSILLVAVQIIAASCLNSSSSKQVGPGLAGAFETPVTLSTKDDPILHPMHCKPSLCSPLRPPCQYRRTIKNYPHLQTQPGCQTPGGPHTPYYSHDIPTNAASRKTSTNLSSTANLATAPDFVVVGVDVAVYTPVGATLETELLALVAVCDGTGVPGTPAITLLLGAA